jgi:hypothetical protein
MTNGVAPKISVIADDAKPAAIRHRTTDADSFLPHQPLTATPRGFRASGVGGTFVVLLIAPTTVRFCLHTAEIGALYSAPFFGKVLLLIALSIGVTGCVVTTPDGKQYE